MGPEFLFPVISTVKPVLSDHSKIDNTKVLKTDYCFIEVKRIAECSPLEHSTILLTCIKQYSVLKNNFGFLLSGCLRQVLL